MATTSPKKKAKKAPVKKSAKEKKETVVQTVEIIEAPIEAAIEVPQKDDALYKLKLSASLKTKIADLAEDEGLTEEEFLSELIAEGIVVRAYDQWERRQHMRGPGPQTAPSQGQQRRGGGNRNNRNNNNNRRGNHKRYQNLMEDNSSFLEYVRNQEKKGNR